MTELSPQEQAPAIDASIAPWIRWLFPLMGLVLIAGVVFFAFTSLTELREFYDRVEQQPIDLTPVFEAGQDLPITAKSLEFEVLATLEAEALSRRYAQVNATMLARVWTRQMGFVTGMILAIIGAAFVLGRLQDPPTKLEAEGGGFKTTLDTNSPGLVLGTLGAGLMALTIAVPFKVETRDVAVYLGKSVGVADLPPPRAVSEINVIETPDSEVSPSELEQLENDLFNSE